MLPLPPAPPQANVLLSRNLTAKIGDVGLSRLAPSLAPGGQSTVLDTRLVGTPSFMDPGGRRLPGGGVGVYSHLA